MAKRKQPKQVTTLTHGEAKRTNIPTAEYQSVMRKDDAQPVEVRYERGNDELAQEKAERNADLDPQLVWRGKDRQDWSDLVVNAPPLYIQEKVSPKALIDDLRRQSVASDQWIVDGKSSSGHSPLSTNHSNRPAQADLFGDFNGLPEGADTTDFYRYEGNWQNRMILGDSLQAMASLAEREGLRGKVQCIYFDPPYGIKFNSNFQWSTTNRDVKDGKADHITREPEQVKAFRDTWRDGIHSYLTYLRDRLTVARDLLTESGSIFVQIGDENVHRVRAVMDEVFGEDNFCGQIMVQKTSGAGSPAIGTDVLAAVSDYVVWFAKNKSSIKYRQLYREKILGEEGTTQYVNFRYRDSMSDSRLSKIEGPVDKDSVFASDNLTSSTGAVTTTFRISVEGKEFRPKKGGWKTNAAGMKKLGMASRLKPIGKTLMYRRYLADFGVSPINNLWRDVLFTGFAEEKVYVVQSAQRLIQRCVLMATAPGDLVLDPTCGSGTTATVAEQWGRRWITIDTSRVALALARARIMGARYPYYLLADSREGQQKEAEVTRSVPRTTPTYGNIAHGFVYQRVPHITLKAIANNSEIDVIWEKFEQQLAPLREQLSETAGDEWIVDSRKDKHYDVELPNVIQEWEIPRERPDHWPQSTQSLITDFWDFRIARQREIDASIAAKADHEYLYDKPFDDKKKVRLYRV